MHPCPRHRLQRALLGLSLAFGLGHAAQADGNRFAAATPVPPTYQQTECASCHLAYPAGLLPAASWQRLMNNLPRHFGTDASLDPASVKNAVSLARSQCRRHQAGARSAARGTASHAPRGSFANTTK